MKYQANFNVVLVEPEIPQNTGNIGRTCVGTQSVLHLVEPLGFDLSEKQVRRAGLDYWPHLEWKQHKSYEAWQAQVPDMSRVFYLSTKAKKTGGLNLNGICVTCADETAKEGKV